MRSGATDSATCWSRECTKGRGLFGFRYTEFEVSGASIGSMWEADLELRSEV